MMMTVLRAAFTNVLRVYVYAWKYLLINCCM